jgi:hypothetical protein
MSMMDVRLKSDGCFDHSGSRPLWLCGCPEDANDLSRYLFEQIHDPRQVQVVPPRPCSSLSSTVKCAVGALMQARARERRASVVSVQTGMADQASQGAYDLIHEDDGKPGMARVMPDSRKKSARNTRFGRAQLRCSERIAWFAGVQIHQGAIRIEPIDIGAPQVQRSNSSLLSACLVILIWKSSSIRRL